MALEIRHKRAEHTHENQQFRRVAIGLKTLFQERDWDGLLIGNPEAEDFSRFRADAILLYNHGLIIIDFKDYSGRIQIPQNDQDFALSKWYNESEIDKQRIEIKAGSRFINPFIQLKSYREVMYEIINSNIILKNNLDPSRTCAINIFSGPITKNRDTPRSIPYYKVVQESDLHTFLYDYSSRNSFLEETSEVLKALFPAEPWEEHLMVPELQSNNKKIIEIESDVENEIINFLKGDGNGILVLESLHSKQRDEWMQYILDRSIDFGIPQTEVLAHSSRISRKIGKRSGITPHSLFNTIYGGNSNSREEETRSDNNSDEEANMQEVVPLKSDNTTDESAVIILHEAHLVTRSLHQTELLRFGTGRLLEDLLQHLSLETTKRKLICIGDPYSLSYGNEKESSISLDTLKDLFDGRINHYRQKPQDLIDNQRDKMRTQLAKSIDNGIFNKITYQWNSDDFIEVEKADIAHTLKKWYSEPNSSEPSNTVLVYKNKDAKKINLWVKESCLKNSKKLNLNDILLLNNNINIPDITGFGYPTKLYNGMYLLVKEVKEDHDIPVQIKQSNQPVILRFTKIRVKCLSLHNQMETDVWLLNNYFNSDDKLSLNEQIAFKVLINKRVNEKQIENPFESSWEYKQLQQDKEYSSFLKEEKELTIQHSEGEKVKTKLLEKQRDIRRVERRYKKRYRQKAFQNVASTDPIVNAVFASYGWAITVHKALGSNFNKVILKANQGENRGITNADYYRWLYSAITCSENKLFIANPMEINPFKDCNFVDNVDVGINTDNGQGRKNNELIFESFEIADSLAEKLNDDLLKNVKGAICSITNRLESDNLILVTTERKGEYLTKAYYSKGNIKESELRIAISNNSSGAVTSIRIEKSSGIDITTIQESISAIQSSESQSNDDNTQEWPSDFREEIYNKWKDKFISTNWDFNLVESHAHQDIFEIKKEMQKAQFRVYYSNQGFLTNITVIEKSHIDLGNQLKDWLLD